MITTYFNPADIVYACEEIRAHGEEPIIYVSVENAAHFTDFIVLPPITKSAAEINESELSSGYIGKYKGALIYVTKAVGDCFVIVPRYKEEKVQ